MQTTDTTTIYAAHIVTTEAHGLGDPEVVVMTDADETGAADLIACYSLTDGHDPIDVLAGNGWRVIGGTTEVETGYVIVDVEAANPVQIVQHVTFARAAADSEAKRQDTAWRMIIRNSMLDGASATKLAKAAEISRERVYQIRDGRR
jgi:hypothetical protein